MEIRGKGVTASRVVEIIETVSAEQYNGNLAPVDEKPLGQNDYGFRGRVRAIDSRAYGARTSSSGRHGPYASWEAYRDVLIAIFEEWPHATVRTGLAYYRGREGFEEGYPDTAYINIGSQMQPAYMPELSI